MDDRSIMENLLLLEKGVCDLYMHGAIESSTQNVRSTFSESLNSALNMQEQIYAKMQQHGWYAPEQAESSKLSSVKMKFAQG